MSFCSYIVTYIILVLTVAGIVLEIVVYDDLNAAMEKIIDQMGMINYPPWRLKVVQISMV